MKLLELYLNVFPLRHSSEGSRVDASVSHHKQLSFYRVITIMTKANTACVMINCIFGDVMTFDNVKK